MECFSANTTLPQQNHRQCYCLFTVIAGWALKKQEGVSDNVTKQTNLKFNRKIVARSRFCKKICISRKKASTNNFFQITTLKNFLIKAKKLGRKKLADCKTS